MKVVKGQHNFAKIYTDEVEQTALDQIELLCNQPWTKGLSIRIMPDVHAGAGCTIGTTMEVKDYVVPNLVGVDIGCGMEVAKLEPQDIDLVKLDRFVRKKIPSGFAKRSTLHEVYAPLAREKVLDIYATEAVAKAGGIDAVLASVGTLGGGNHFIEMNKNEAGEYEKNIARTILESAALEVDKRWHVLEGLTNQDSGYPKQQVDQNNKIELQSILPKPKKRRK